MARTISSKSITPSPFCDNQVKKEEEQGAGGRVCVRARAGAIRERSCGGAESIETVRMRDNRQTKCGESAMQANNTGGSFRECARESTASRAYLVEEGKHALGHQVLLHPERTQAVLERLLQPRVWDACVCV